MKDIVCSNGDILTCHLLDDNSGFYVKRTIEETTRIIAGISIYKDKLVIYDKYEKNMEKGYGKPLVAYPSDHYKDYPIEATTSEDVLLYCICENNTYRFGVYNNEDFEEYLVVDEEGCACILEMIK